MGRENETSSKSTVTLTADQERLAEVRTYLTTVQTNEKTKEETLIIDVNAAYYQYYQKLRNLVNVDDGPDNNERVKDLDAYLKGIIDLKDENEAYSNTGYTEEQVKNFVEQSESYDFDEKRYLALGRELDKLNEERSKEEATLNELEEKLDEKAKRVKDYKNFNFHETKLGGTIDSMFKKYIDGDNKLARVLDVVDEDEIQANLGDDLNDGGLRDELEALLYCKKQISDAYANFSVFRNDNHPEDHQKNFLTTMMAALVSPLSKYGVYPNSQTGKLEGTDDALKNIGALIAAYDKKLKSSKAKNDETFSKGLTYFRSCYAAYKELITQAETLFKENNLTYIIESLDREIKNNQMILDDYDRAGTQYGDQGIKVQECRKLVENQVIALNGQLDEVIKSAAALKNSAEDISKKAELKLQKIEQRRKDAEEKKRKEEEEKKRKEDEEKKRKADEDAKLKAEQEKIERLKREAAEKIAALEKKYPAFRKIREDHQKAKNDLDILTKEFAKKYPDADDVNDMILVGAETTKALEEKYGANYIEDLKNFYLKKSYLSRRMQSLAKDYELQRELLLEKEETLENEADRTSLIKVENAYEHAAGEQLIEGEKEGLESEFASEDQAPDLFEEFKKNENKPEISTLGYFKELKRLAKALDATKGIGQNNTQGFNELYDLMKVFINIKEDKMVILASNTTCADFVKTYKTQIDVACNKYVEDHGGMNPETASLNKNQILRLKVMSRFKQLISFAEEKRSLDDPDVKKEMLAEKYLNASYSKAYSEAKNPLIKTEALKNMLGFKAILQASKDDVLETKLTDLKNINDTAELDKLLKKRAQVFLGTVEKGGLKDIAKQNAPQNAAENAIGK